MGSTRGSTTETSRRSMMTASQNPLNSTQMKAQEEKEELGLYLFKPQAKNKLLSFRKVANQEFPMRLLHLDQLEVCQDDDGFDMIVQTSAGFQMNMSMNASVSSQASPSTSASSRRRSKGKRGVAKKSSIEDLQRRSIYVLCFVNLLQIEAYLKAHGELMNTDDIATQQDFSQLSKSIMNNSK